MPKPRLPISMALLLLAALMPTPALWGNEVELVVVDATAPPPHLDPFKVYGTQAQSLFRLIYAPLFDRDVDGKIVTPLLERWAQVDTLTWEFRLRPGIRFHDGGELTAADVVFSLKRIVDPAVSSPRRHEFEELHQVIALDQRTVRVITKNPYALLPARLSQFSMILPDQLRGRSDNEFFQQPIGIGPFRLSEFNSERAVLTAFPDYFGGAPKVPRVIFRFIADPGERLRRLLEGTVDIVTNVLPQQVDALTRARRVRLLKRNSIRFTDIMLDSTRGPLSKQEVRQALRYGMDVENLVKYVARGNGRPLATFTLPEDFGFDPGLKPYPFDPAKARALMAQAGYSSGFRLRGLATHDTQTLATVVTQQWAKLGVTLEIIVEGRAPAMARWIKERDRYDFLFLDPTSIMFDAAYHIRLHLDPGHPMGRSPNLHAIEALNRADVEKDAGARQILLRGIQRIVYDQVLAIPIYQVVDLYGVGERVHGFVPSVDTILRLANVTLGK